jgi:hypothetical protein
MSTTCQENDDADKKNPMNENSAMNAAATTTVATHQLTTPPPDETTSKIKPYDKNMKHSERSEGTVYVVVDGLRAKIMEIEVKVGDSIASIRTKVKNYARNTFASVDAQDLDLFESEQQIDSSSYAKGKLLDPLNEWDPNVSWGTKQQPMIVYTPKATNKNGMYYILCVRACVCVCHDMY